MSDQPPPVKRFTVDDLNEMRTWLEREGRNISCGRPLDLRSLSTVDNLLQLVKDVTAIVDAIDNHRILPPDTPTTTKDPS